MRNEQNDLKVGRNEGKIRRDGKIYVEVVCQFLTVLR